MDYGWTGHIRKLYFRHLDGHKQKTCFCKICEKGFGSEAKVREHHRKVHERKAKKVKNYYFNKHIKTLSTF